MNTVHPLYQARHGLDEAAIDLLGLELYAVLGTENPDASPHLAPVIYLFEQATAYIATSAATRKARNVASRPRATLLVLDRRVDGTAWVSGTGAATVLRGDEAQRTNRRVRARYLTQKGEQSVGSAISAYEDATIAITPEKWMAWDTTVYDATLAEHGVSLKEDAGLFR